MPPDLPKKLLRLRTQPETNFANTPTKHRCTTVQKLVVRAFLRVQLRRQANIGSAYDFGCIEAIRTEDYDGALAASTMVLAIFTQHGASRRMPSFYGVSGLCFIARPDTAPRRKTTSNASNVNTRCRIRIFRSVKAEPTKPNGIAMKKLLPTILILLSGCATQQVVPLNVQGIEHSEQVRLQDLRPPLEKQGEIFSILLTSDAYAIYRVAEDTSSPAAVRLLQHRAFETLGARVKPLEIKIHHLIVYRNMQSELRRGAIGVGIGGVLGGLIGANTVKDSSGTASSLVDTNAFNSLHETEFKRALYSDEENPGRGSVHIVYIESEINGKRVFTRTLAPTKAKDGESAISNVLEAATKYHLAQY